MTETSGGEEEVRCAECGTALAGGQDREVTDNGVFCRPCFNNLTAKVQQALDEQGRNVNYPMAVVGALGGAAIGVVAWWGFTILTKIQFGLVAVVIGVCVAKGASILAGNKRAQGLQILAVAVSAVAFGYATYLVNRSFINEAYAAQGAALPLLPSPDLMIEVIRAGFELFDLIFLAIVLYEAWIIPRPLKLGA